MESLNGLFSALLTPVRPDGEIDFEQLSRLIDFVLSSGVDGICIGGATSEYPHFDIAQRRELISFAAEQLRGRGRLIVAIGSSSYFQSLKLGRQAADVGSDALMLPMPHFFHYDQADLMWFCRRIARELAFPVLIYHLPQFTQQLSLEAIIELINSEEFIVGIKDSSGDPVCQRLLSSTRSKTSFRLFVGNDSLVVDGLRAGWDGVISGISSCCPELLVSLYASIRRGDLEAAEAYHRSIQELIQRVSQLPFPWGLKSIL